MESLAPELLILILQKLDRPRDLYSAISAVPAFFNVFSQSQARILSSVVQRAIEPEALYHALAILHVPDSRSRGAPGTSDLRREAITRFSSQYFGFGLSEMPKDLESITTLAHLYQMATPFIDSYFARAIKAIGMSPDEAPPLSNTERARLQRAFFRYELYSSLFYSGRDDTWGGSIFPSDTQFPFLQGLGPWQVEEMSCVHQHYTTLIGEFMDQLEDELVERVLGAPGAQRAPSPDPFDDDPEEPLTGEDDPQARLVPFECLGVPELAIFSTSGRIRSRNFLNYIASLGLPFLRKLAVSDMNTRKDMIRANTPIWRDFLPEALEHGATEGLPTVFSMASLAQDDPKLPNMGYCRFKRSMQDLFIRIDGDGIVNSPLRARGYVFWDVDRINVDRVTESLRQAERMNIEEVNAQFGRFMGKSVEERLKGVLIPKAQMDGIRKEFASEHWLDPLVRRFEEILRRE